MYVKQNMPSVDIKVFDANLMAIKHVNKTKKVDMDELWKMLQKEKMTRRADSDSDFEEVEFQCGY